jgi:hypothetical protein
MLGFAMLSSKIKIDAPSRLKNRVGTGVILWNYLTHYTYDFAALYRTYTLISRTPSALGAAVCVGQKMDKKASCLNVAKRREFRRFPIFWPTQTGTPQGLREFVDSAVAFFCLLFFGEPKKSE